MKAVISVLDSNLSYTISENDTIRLGRSEDNDISFSKYKNVSRQHAVLSISNGRLVITSSGKNGTFINDSIIRNNIDVSVQTGDRIRLADGPHIKIMKIDHDVLRISGKRKYFLIPVLSLSLAFLFIFLYFLNQNQLNKAQEEMETKISEITMAAESNKMNLEEQIEKTKSLEEELEILKESNKELFKYFDRQINDIMRAPPVSERENDEFPISLKDSIYLIASADAGNNIYSCGTAFPVDNRGLLCTNFHVIQGAKNIYIKRNNTYIAAAKIYTDSEKDIALLRINQKTIPLRTRYPGERDIGKTVYAVGFPWFQYTGDNPTVTKGIISGYTADGLYIITDAPINQGNSGGPLIDENGFVLGMNSFVIRENYIESGGFALNIRHIMEVIR